MYRLVTVTSVRAALAVLGDFGNGAAEACPSWRLIPIFFWGHQCMRFLHVRKVHTLALRCARGLARSSSRCDDAAHSRLVRSPAAPHPARGSPPGSRLPPAPRGRAHRVVSKLPPNSREGGKASGLEAPRDPARFLFSRGLAFFPERPNGSGSGSGRPAPVLPTTLAHSRRKSGSRRGVLQSCCCCCGGRREGGTRAAAAPGRRNTRNERVVTSVDASAHCSRQPGAPERAAAAELRQA